MQCIHMTYIISLTNLKTVCSLHRPVPSRARLMLAAVQQLTRMTAPFELSTCMLRHMYRGVGPKVTGLVLYHYAQTYS